MSESLYLTVESSKSMLIREGAFLFTKDKVFAIKPQSQFQIYSTELYVKPEYTIDPDSALASLIRDGVIVPVPKAVKKIGKIPYKTYMFYRKLVDDRKYTDQIPDENDVTSTNENDCLTFAECLTHVSRTHDVDMMNHLLKNAGNTPPVLQTKSNETIFGESANKNRKLLKKIKVGEKNNFALPESGETYAIVRKAPPKKDEHPKAPYHIAFVLYTYNGVNITLEAEADAGNTYKPRFALYDTNPEGNTFHRNWTAELYKESTDPEHKKRPEQLYSGSETIVLKPRDLAVVIKEFDESGVLPISSEKPITDRRTDDKIDMDAHETTADKTATMRYNTRKKQREGGKQKNKKRFTKKRKIKSKKNNKI